MLQFIDDIAAGTAAILIKDESFKENPDAEFYKYLMAEGFQMWSKSKGGYKGVDWIYVNLNTKCIARGVPGIPVVSAFGNHAITIEEFKEIYKKYDGLSVLQLTKIEQEEWQKKIQSMEFEAEKMNEEEIPTLSEFMELVKEEYWMPDWVIGKAEALRYFYSDEAQDYIKEAYKQAVEDYNNGKLGIKGFRIGQVAAVSYCLYMMWE